MTLLPEMTDGWSSPQEDHKYGISYHNIVTMRHPGNEIMTTKSQEVGSYLFSLYIISKSGKYSSILYCHMDNESILLPIVSVGCIFQALKVK